MIDLSQMNIAFTSIAGVTPDSFLLKADADKLALAIHGMTFWEVMEMARAQSHQLRKNYCAHTHLELMGSMRMELGKHLSDTTAGLDEFGHRTGVQEAWFTILNQAIVRTRDHATMKVLAAVASGAMPEAGGSDELQRTYSSNAELQAHLKSHRKLDWPTMLTSVLESLTLQQRAVMKVGRDSVHLDQVLTAEWQALQDHDLQSEVCQAYHVAMVKHECFELFNFCVLQPWTEWIRAVLLHEYGSFGTDELTPMFSKAWTTFGWHIPALLPLKVERTELTLQKVSADFWLHFLATPAFKAAAQRFLVHHFALVLVCGYKVPSWVVGPPSAPTICHGQWPKLVPKGYIFNSGRLAVFPKVLLRGE